MANSIIGSTLTTPFAGLKKVSQLENDADYIDMQTASKWDSDVYSMCLSEINYVLSNIGENVDAKIGDIETALGRIIAIQNSLIGGGSE